METGPYGEGHYVIQADLPCSPCGFDVKCTDMVCKSIIKPSAVFEVVKEAIEGEINAFINNSPAWNNLQVYKSHFKDDGYLGFTPLIRQPINRETFYRILYRQLWNIESGPMNGEADKIYDNTSTVMSRYSQFDHFIETILSIRKEMDVLTSLANLSEEGLNLISLIAEEAVKDCLDVRKIKEIWGKVGPIEKKIELIGHTNPCFRPLTLLFMYAKEALEGNDLKIISVESRAIYTDLVNRSRNMLQLMMKAVHLQETGLEGKCSELTYNNQQ